ncbi:MAG: ribonuclease III [Actinobacteria bacterium 21-73-9]|nr:MAG: ribonuclease III [Actinobacteria bacterium 21-73-9]
MARGIDALAARVGLDPSCPALATALTHSSYAAENGVESNERLEFLGDAVVDLVVADLIVTDFPALNEGTGSLVRSRVVNEGSLARAARELDLGPALRVGRGVAKERGHERPSLLADAFEALVAALYLERGFEAARAFVAAALGEALAEAASEPAGVVDPKTLLRQWAESSGLGTPRYEVDARGPAHDARFVARVELAGRELARGEGRSKKAAEVAAARTALEARGA